MAAAWLASLVIVASAQASTPILLSVEHEHRHPTVGFAAPAADDATIYFATSPERATDGRFLEENIAALDFLTAGEIAAGRWEDESQLDPGRYYAMLHATDFDCVLTDNPGCLSGFSAVMGLTVPKPVPRFRGRAKAYRYLGMVDLTLSARPLGEDLRYRVCWTRKRGHGTCRRARIRGWSWNESASDSITVRMRGMRKRTRFVWYAHGRKVASKRIRTRRG